MASTSASGPGIVSQYQNTSNDDLVSTKTSLVAIKDDTTQGRAPRANANAKILEIDAEIERRSKKSNANTARKEYDDAVKQIKDFQEKAKTAALKVNQTAVALRKAELAVRAAVSEGSRRRSRAAANNAASSRAASLKKQRAKTAAETAFAMKKRANSIYGQYKKSEDAISQAKTTLEGKLKGLKDAKASQASIDRINGLIAQAGTRLTTAQGRTTDALAKQSQALEAAKKAIRDARAGGVELSQEMVSLVAEPNVPPTPNAPVNSGVSNISGAASTSGNSGAASTSGNSGAATANTSGMSMPPPQNPITNSPPGNGSSIGGSRKGSRRSKASRRIRTSKKSRRTSRKGSRRSKASRRR